MERRNFLKFAFGLAAGAGVLAAASANAAPLLAPQSKMTGPLLNPRCLRSLPSSIRTKSNISSQSRFVGIIDMGGIVVAGTVIVTGTAAAGKRGRFKINPGSRASDRGLF